MGDGALAVRVAPRYVLHNALEVNLQCKQQGTNVERELGTGGARLLELTWIFIDLVLISEVFNNFLRPEILSIGSTCAAA